MPGAVFRARIPIGLPSSNRGGARRQSYWLYRVYNLSSSPKLYRLQGPLGEKLDLEPKVYAAGTGTSRSVPRVSH